MELEAFEVSYFADLNVLVHAFVVGGHLVLLIGGEQGGHFAFLFLFEGQEAGFILLQREVVLFVEVRAFLAVFQVDGGDLFSLFGSITDVFAAEAVATEAMMPVMTEAAVCVAVGAAAAIGVTPSVHAIAVMHRGVGWIPRRLSVEGCGPE